MYYLLIRGKESPYKIILMLKFGLNAQTLILHTVKTLNKCILFCEYGFRFWFAFNGIKTCENNTLGQRLTYPLENIDPQ